MVIVIYLFIGLLTTLLRVDAVFVTYIQQIFDNSECTGKPVREFYRADLACTDGQSIEIISGVVNLLSWSDSACAGSSSVIGTFTCVTEAASICASSGDLGVLTFCDETVLTDNRVREFGDMTLRVYEGDCDGNFEEYPQPNCLRTSAITSSFYGTSSDGYGLQVTYDNDSCDGTVTTIDTSLCNYCYESITYVCPSSVAELVPSASSILFILVSLLALF